MRMSNNLVRGALAVGLALVLGACGRSVTSGPEPASNLEEWVANVKARPAPPLDPLPVMQQFETFEYAAQGMRDPFSDAFTSKDSGSGPRPDSQRRKQTLEPFPLDSLDMVGTIGTGGGMVGLVVAHAQVVYRNTPGVSMGQNAGLVTAVHEDRIELLPIVPAI